MSSPRHSLALLPVVWAVLLAFASVASADALAPLVTVARLPEGGVQPQAAVDDKGIAHVIYLKGDPAQSDIFYIRTAEGGKSFSKPVRVNSHPGSAVATGTVRGPHLAVGRGGRLHVAWMGSHTAEPKAPGKQAPMLYTRTDDSGNFESQRNLITEQVGLDGGGSVAADDAGNVYVAWHAPLEKGGAENSRLVFAVTSRDEGRRFSGEEWATAFSGVCACCGMRVLAGEGGALVTLYRQAWHDTDRAMRLVTRRAAGRGEGRVVYGGSVEVGPLKSGVCVMSTAALAPVPRAADGRFVAAWEEQGRLRWAHFEPKSATRLLGTIHSIPAGVEHDGAEFEDDGRNRKHPAVAFDGEGRMVLAWTERTGWQKGGSVAWQVYDAKGRPLDIESGAGRADDLPAWDLPAVFARPEGGFSVIY